MRKLIILLIRLRHKLKENEPFRFSNQKSKCDFYYFTTDELKKVCFTGNNATTVKANVSLNWLLNDECKIVKN